MEAADLWDLVEDVSHEGSVNETKCLRPLERFQVHLGGGGREGGREREQVRVRRGREGGRGRKERGQIEAAVHVD